jgi:intraflagellar transport protein 172
MKYKHIKNLQESIDGMKKIFCVTWSPNLMRLAVAHVDEKRIIRISLFDEECNKIESFATKPSSKNSKSYIVREMKFSPDSTKLAIAQSDDIIFIYKLGTSWKDKKIICNKFEQNLSVTCMDWPCESYNEIIYGVADGKVKLGHLKSNSSQILYNTDSYVVSITSTNDGRIIFSGHVDNRIYKFNMNQSSLQVIVNLGELPNCLCLCMNNTLIASGDSNIIRLCDEYGDEITDFDYSSKKDIKEFTCISANNERNQIILGNFSQFVIIGFNTFKQKWEEINYTYIPNYYSITACTWKPYQQGLILGSLCGSVDYFEPLLKKIKLNNNTEISFINNTQIIIRINKNKITIRSKDEIEESKIKIIDSNFVVISNKNSSIFGNIKEGKYSELEFLIGNKDQFIFYDEFLVIFSNNNLLIVEFGVNKILASFASEFATMDTVTVKKYNNKIIFAYLVDYSNVNGYELNSFHKLFTINNYEHQINQIELDNSLTKMLLRDNKNNLMIYFFDTETYVILKRLKISQNCLSATWVPWADILLIQNLDLSIHIWYVLNENGDGYNVKLTNIKSKIDNLFFDDINKQHRIITETEELNLNIDLCKLSENITKKDCIEVLKNIEKIESFSSTEEKQKLIVYWEILKKISLEKHNLFTLQRSYAALDDYSKVIFVNKLLKLQQNKENLEDKNNILLSSYIYALEKDYDKSERLLTQHKMLNELFQLFIDFHKYDSAIRIVETNSLQINTDEIKNKINKHLQK